MEENEILEEQTLEGAPPATDNESKKVVIVSGLRERYPDDDFDDDETLFSRISDEFSRRDEEMAERVREEQGLSDLLSSDPRSASFLLNWKNGSDPLVEFVRTFGDDITEALKDPEKMDAFNEAREDWLERLSESKALKEESEANLPVTLEELESVISEMGLSDEDAEKAFVFFDGIVNDAIRNKVTADTWKMVFKAMNYDKAVEEALHDGEVKGRNEKIDGLKKRKEVPGEVPPALEGGAGAPKKPSTPSYGAIDRALQQTAWDSPEKRTRRK